MRTASSIAEVVTSGLCIGCGLCEAVTGGRIPMVMTGYGGLRPTPADSFTPEEEAKLLSACPGVSVETRFPDSPQTDLVWGSYSSMRFAWAGDPEVRFRAATGGALTALGAHLLHRGEVAFVLHVEADPARPLRSRWTVSETPEAVIAAAGSRYGPVAPLSGFVTALDRNEPFALIAKPCDLSAVHRLSKSDPRVDALCTLRMAMVCGGQSRLTKAQDLLAELSLDEEEVTVFRHRGFGNPGRTRIETRDGRAFERTYMELWADEAGWQLETRCKICPDALGEAADIAAADVWPGGSPTGEDAGFNGIVVRSQAGKDLVAAAVTAGDLVLGDAITPRQFDDFQPHQVRKKQALAARFDGMQAEGAPTVETSGLRLDRLAARLESAASERERNGARQRTRDGKFAEPLPGKTERA